MINAHFINEGATLIIETEDERIGIMGVEDNIKLLKEIEKAILFYRHHHINQTNETTPTPTPNTHLGYSSAD